MRINLEIGFFAAPSSFLSRHGCGGQYIAPSTFSINTHYSQVLSTFDGVEGIKHAGEIVMAGAGRIDRRRSRKTNQGRDAQRSNSSCHTGSFHYLRLQIRSGSVIRRRIRKSSEDPKPWLAISVSIND